MSTQSEIRRLITNVGIKMRYLRPRAIDIKKKRLMLALRE